MDQTQYYKSVRGRHAGRLTVILFHKVEGELNTHVDTTRKRVRVNTTFGSIPHTVYPATKEEYESAHDEVMAYTNLRHLH